MYEKLGDAPWDTHKMRSKVLMATALCPILGIEFDLLAAGGHYAQLFTLQSREGLDKGENEDLKGAAE